MDYGNQIKARSKAMQTFVVQLSCGRDGYLPTEKAGWTQPAPQLPGLEILLDDVESFAHNVMCQHYIISYGNNTEAITNLCDMLGIQVVN